MRTPASIAAAIALAAAAAFGATRVDANVDGAAVAALPVLADAPTAPQPARSIGGFPVAEVRVRPQEFPRTPYNGRFVFTRIQFDVGGGMDGFFRGRRGEPPWHHDHPSAEYNFAKILETVTFVRPSLESSNILMLDDESIFMYPILYMVEPGFWRPNEREIENLRNYLLKGGFMIFDDFDDRQMYNLAEIFRMVLPELPFVPMDPEDEIFDSFFELDPRTLSFGGAAYRGDQIDFWGIHEDNDPEKRLLVIAGNRGDLGEFWEFSDTGFFPIDITNEAYKVGVNYIVYAMTH